MKQRGVDYFQLKSNGERLYLGTLTAGTCIEENDVAARIRWGLYAPVVRQDGDGWKTVVEARDVR